MGAAGGSASRTTKACRMRATIAPHLGTDKVATISTEEIRWCLLFGRKVRRAHDLVGQGMVSEDERGHRLRHRHRAAQHAGVSVAHEETTVQGRGRQCPAPVVDRSGSAQGGITNGETASFRVAFKPTRSLFRRTGQEGMKTGLSDR